MLFPKRIKYRKQMRGRMRGSSFRGSEVTFGDFGLQATEPGWVSARQIEAARRTITHAMRRRGKFWIRIFPDKPVTRKPAETRMGKGKGNVEYWVAVVRPGRVIGIRQTLYVNLAISLAVTLVVLFLTHLVLTRYQQRIEEMASVDELTGLLNRHAFTILVDKLLAEHRRSPMPISVLLADLDHFKAINDQNGHLAGDRVLGRVAKIISGALRQSDLAVRWGGEEFLLVLKDCDSGEAQKIAEKLRQAVEAEAFDVGGRAISVSLSIGVAEYDGIEAPERTIGRADEALYAAKEGGRNRVYLAAPTVN